MEDTRAVKKRKITQQQDTVTEEEDEYDEYGDDDQALWEGAAIIIDEEEDAAYRAQEAALAAKYGYNIQQPSTTSSTAGFTSGRGKALDLPSKEALERAKNILQSPTKSDYDHGDGISTASTLKKASIHDSGFMSVSRAVNNNINNQGGLSSAIDTPLHARSNHNRAAQLIQTDTRKNGSNGTPTAFKAPTRTNAASSVHSAQQHGKPSLQPLRFGPKGKATLLQPRMAVATVETATAEEEDMEMDVQEEQDLDTFASTSKILHSANDAINSDAPGYHSTRDDTNANPALLIHPSSSSSSSSPSRPSAKTSDINFGLSTGSGKAFVLPSERSIAREKSKSTNSATSLEGDEDSHIHTSIPESEHTEKITNTPFKPLAKSTSNNGKATPSRSSSTSSHTSNISLASISEFGGFTSGAGKPVALPSEEAMLKSLRAFDGDASSSSQQTGKEKEKEKDGEAPITPSRPVLAMRNSNIPSSSSSSVNQARNQNQDTVPVVQEVFPPLNTQISFSTPIAARTLRQPFRAPTRTSSTPSQTPMSSSARHLSGIGTSMGAGVGVPSGSQASGFTRLNLEMNQRNTPTTAMNRGTFRTPFKNGVKPSASGVSAEKMVLSVNRNSNVGNAQGRPVAGGGGKGKQAIHGEEKGTQMIRRKEKKKDIICKDSVFDLVNRPATRMNMREYGLKPGYRVSDLIDEGIPKEIIFMTYPKACTFSFVLGSEHFGAEAAYDELVKYSGCRVSLEWVKNHWGLIVWKLAGIVRSKPEMEILAAHWGFDKVCDQLKYRYEREYIAGQRSCLKRIQEKDSSASSPLVLLITQILYEERQVPIPLPEGQVLPEGQEPEMTTEQVAVGLEVSDGWYRMKTNLDEALYRAVWFGKIFPGMKIAIQGAKTDGSTDGAEPLEAYDSSTLVISGNGTSRASWSSKLGFVYHLNPLTHQVSSPPFICSFRSLLPDGGLVPLVDVRITRVYNKGYRGEYVEGKSQDVWNSEEERERQRTWEKEREKALHDIQRAQQANLMKIVDIRNRLQQALSSRSASTSSAKKPKDESLIGCDFTDIYTQLEEEPSSNKVGGLIGRLDRETLGDTLEYANRRLENMQNQAGEDARKEIEERCPPRVAKEFVIVRCVDSHAKNTSEGRDCVLNVSEPSKLGDNLLTVGKRYLLSNTVPMTPRSWSSLNAVDGEIFLSTRYDTRFYPL